MDKGRVRDREGTGKGRVRYSKGQVRGGVKEG